MSDEIKEVQALTPSPLVKILADDKQHPKKKKHKSSDKIDSDNDKKHTDEHHGLFDEYV